MVWKIRRAKKAVSDEEEDCSDYADSKQEIGSKEFKFQKELFRMKKKTVVIMQIPN